MENRKKVTIRKNTCVKEPSGDYKIRHQPRGMTQAGDTIPGAQNLSRELVARFPPPLQRAITSLCKLKPRCATWFLEKVPVPEGGLEGKAKSLGFSFQNIPISFSPYTWYFPPRVPRILK